MSEKGANKFFVFFYFFQSSDDFFFEFLKRFTDRIG